MSPFIVVYIWKSQVKIETNMNNVRIYIILPEKARWRKQLGSELTIAYCLYSVVKQSYLFSHPLGRKDRVMTKKNASGG